MPGMPETPLISLDHEELVIRRGRRSGAYTIIVLEGNYITAEDVGTSARDMAVIAERTKWVTGLGRNRGGSGDPSPYTAMGVEAAMRACCERVFGSPDLKGRTVAVVGAGRVGSQLAKRLARAGAKLVVADIDQSRRAAIETRP